MKERWIEPAPDSDEKQETFFNQVINNENIPFENDEAKTAFRERWTLMKDAVQMKKPPKRIPVCPAAGSFPLEYAGVSWKDALYDYEAATNAFEKYALDFPCDAADPGSELVSGKVLDILDFKLCVWPGQSLADDQAYQYVEKEYMKADEYQDFIDDPTGWCLNVYFPRIFGGLEGFKSFPDVSVINEISKIADLTVPFAFEPLSTAIETLKKAAEESMAWIMALGRVHYSLMGKGYMSMGGSIVKAPFDSLGDTLRGTKEIMMDMFRRPDEVIEACERITPLTIKAGVRGCIELQNNLCFIPLHKGGDGFMSDEQFRRFYWPTLRKLAIGLIDQGIVPWLFAEGSYNSRLEAISDLPGGKVIWHFERTDMKRAKETVGKNSCIMGNVPLDLLYAGTPDEVREYCKELIDVAGKGGGYIFSTAGGGMEGTKPENIKAMTEFALEYGVYR